MAVNPRDKIRLADDQRLRPHQELADRRRRRHPFGAAAEHANRWIAQNAKTGPTGTTQGPALGPADIVVVADPEEREVALGKPFEEGDRLGTVLCGDRRRRGPIGLDHGAEPGQHVRPVGDGTTHLHKERLQAFREPLARLLAAEATEVNLDEALPHGAFGCRPGAEIVDEPAGRIASNVDDRMGHQAHIHSIRAKLGQRRIEEERHVAVEDAEHGDGTARRTANRRIGKPDHGRVGLAHGKERIGHADEAGEIAGTVDR